MYTRQFEATTSPNAYQIGKHVLIDSVSIVCLSHCNKAYNFDKANKPPTSMFW